MIKSVFNFRLFLAPAALLAVLQFASDWVLPHLNEAIVGDEPDVMLAVSLAFGVTVLLYFLVCFVVVAFFWWKQGVSPDEYQLLRFAVFYEICVLVLIPYYVLVVSWLDGSLEAFMADMKAFAAEAQFSLVDAAITFGFTTIFSGLISIGLTWISLWLAGKVLGLFWKQEEVAPL